MTQTDTNIKIGREIGGFRIQKLLGQGNTGIVYQALQVNLNRPVALKILYKHISEDEDFVKAFFREAQAAAAFTHPNIVQAYDVGIEDGLYYFAMEIIDGSDLEILLKKEKRLDWKRTLETILPIAGALEHGHSKRGLTHGDIKPANIMLDENNGVKLADLGLARMGTEESDSDSSAIMLTPLYAAPEMISGDWKVGQAHADMYSLGATIFHMLAGHPPYEASSYQEVLQMHQHTPLPNTREEIPDAPERIHQLLNRLLAKKTEDRFCDWQEVVKFMNLCLDEPTPAQETTTQQEKAPEKSKTHPLAIILLMIIAGAGFLTFRTYSIKKELLSIEQNFSNEDHQANVKELQAFLDRHSLYNPFEKNAHQQIESIKELIQQQNKINQHNNVLNQLNSQLAKPLRSGRLEEMLKRMQNSFEENQLTMPESIQEDTLFAFHRDLKKEITRRFEQQKRKEKRKQINKRGPLIQKERQFYSTLEKMKQSLQSFKEGANELQKTSSQLAQAYQSRTDDYTFFTNGNFSQAITVVSELLESDEYSKILNGHLVKIFGKNKKITAFRNGILTTENKYPYGVVRTEVNYHKSLSLEEIISLIEQCSKSKNFRKDQWKKLLPIYIIAGKKPNTKILHASRPTIQSALNHVIHTKESIAILNKTDSMEVNKANIDGLLRVLNGKKSPLARKFSIQLEILKAEK